MPQVDGSGIMDEFWRLSGTDGRGKNQTETPVGASSVAQTPPPLAAKAAPYETLVLSLEPQPELALA